MVSRATDFITSTLTNPFTVLNKKFDYFKIFGSRNGLNRIIKAWMISFVTGPDRTGIQNVH